MNTHNNQGWMGRLRALECHDATFHDQPAAVVLKRGQGSLVWDVEGNEYIDLSSGFGSLPLGHNHQGVVESLHENIKDSMLVHGLGDVHPSSAKVDLMEELANWLPARLAKGALSLSGGQAVEYAVKTCIQAKQSNVFIAFKGAYHGLDLGILGLNGREDFKAPFSAAAGLNVFHLDYGADLSVLDAQVRKIQENNGPVAGIIVEPIQGRGGVISPGLDWLSGLSVISKNNGIAFILDEVFTGIGRTGRELFASQIECDLVCLGKAIGGGFPLSACFGTEEMMDAWPKSQGEALHTGTFFGHPFSCLVGTKTLQIARREGLTERASSFGRQAKHQLQAMVSSVLPRAHVRGEGLMLCLDLGLAGQGVELSDQLRRDVKVITIPCGPGGQGISLSPALNIPEDLFLEAVARIKTTLAKI